MILFETKRMMVRQFVETDLDNLYGLSSNSIIMQHIREPMSLDACRDLLAELIKGYSLNARVGRFAVIEKRTGLYAGNFLLRPSSFADGTEIGYAFLQHLWGCGYATEITTSGVQFAFDDLQCRMVYAVTGMLNIASQKVLLKSGFKRRPNFIEKNKELCLFETINAGQ